MPEFNRTRALCFVILATLFAIVLWFSLTTLWIGDDFNFMFAFGDDGKFSDTPIAGFADLLANQGKHWIFENGRLVSHFLVRLFNIYLGQQAFAFCNAAVWVALALVLVRLARRQIRPATLITAALLMFAVFRTRMVPSCQIGYPWMFLLSSLWLMLLNSQAMSRKRPIALLISIFLFSVIAGNGAETINIPLGAAILWQLIRHRDSRSAARLVMLAGFAVGGLILVLSPATRGRAEDLHISLFGSIFYLAIFSLTIYLLLATMAGAKLLCKRKIRSIYADNSLWFNGLLVSLMFNLVIGVAVTRQLFAIEFFSAIIIINLLRGHRTTLIFNTLGCVALALWLRFNHLANSAYAHQFSLITAEANIGSRNIFADTWSCVSYPYIFSFGTGPSDPIHCHDAHNINSMRRFLKARNHAVADFDIIPKYLEGKDNTHLPDTVMTIQPGLTLIVCSANTGHPRKVTAARRLGFGSFSRPYDTIDLDIYDPVRQTPLWKAWLIEYPMYGVEIDKINFEQ